MSDTVHDVIIIGSGPAGYTAATYAARAELKPLVFEGTQFGGALMTTTEVENFSGFPTGIQGPDLMDNMREQALRFGADLRMDDVTEVDLRGPEKIVTTASEGTFKARTVIIATGAAARYLGVPGEQLLLGRGVSACATCDGFFFKNQHIAVVGGGDSAMEEALFLTRFAASVTIIHRSDQFRASPIMVDRARAHEKIRFETYAQVTQVHGETAVTGVTLTDPRSGETRELPLTGLFIAIGHDPRSELFADQLQRDPAGYITVEHPSSRTSLAGVFAAGDVVDSHYQQAITAAGSGCVAALDAQNWLADNAADPAHLGGTQPAAANV